MLGTARFLDRLHGAVPLGQQHFFTSALLFAKHVQAHLQTCTEEPRSSADTFPRKTSRRCPALHSHDVLGDLCNQ